MRNPAKAVVKAGLRLCASVDSLFITHGCARILTYHSIIGGMHSGTNSACVYPDELRRQLSWLQSSGYAIVPLQNIVDRLRGRQEIPARWISLTFDDGFADFYTNGFPVLADLGVNATLFVTSNLVGTAGYMTAGQLVELVERGFEVGAHACDHISLTSVPPDKACAQVICSKKSLEDMLGREVTCFCYPYGDRNDTIEDSVRSAGFLSCCIEEAGPILTSTSPFRLPRVGILGTDSQRDFELRIRGAYDWWTNAYLQLRKRRQRIQGSTYTS